MKSALVILLIIVTFCIASPNNQDTSEMFEQRNNISDNIDNIDIHCIYPMNIQ